MAPAVALRAAAVPVPADQPSHCTMKLLRGLQGWEAFRNGTVSIGNFDGVHRGHQRLIERLVSHARRMNGPAVALTFDPPPSALLRPDRTPPRLTTLETRAELLGALGVDAVVVYPTDRELLSLSPDEFFQDFVLNRFAARAIVEGENFCFGKARAGTVETLQTLCRQNRLICEIVPTERLTDQLISSSEIRARILSGNIAAACELLGHGYRIAGMVSPGAQRGRTLGFPTANLEGCQTLLPPHGVYAGIALSLNRPCVAAVNIGPNPTFGETATKIEAHLIDFQGDLYGRELAIDLVTRVRDVIPFRGVEGLKEQIAADVRTATSIVSPLMESGWEAWSRTIVRSVAVDPKSPIH